MKYLDNFTSPDVLLFRELAETDKTIESICQELPFEVLRDKSQKRGYWDSSGLVTLPFSENLKSNKRFLTDYYSLSNDPSKDRFGGKIDLVISSGDSPGLVTSVTFTYDSEVTPNDEVLDHAKELYNNSSKVIRNYLESSKTA